MGCIFTHQNNDQPNDGLDTVSFSVKPVADNLIDVSLQSFPTDVSLQSFPKDAQSLDQIFDMKGQVVVAKVVKIYDGDTITCIINNMNQWIKYRIRLSDIDTCEMKLNAKNISPEDSPYIERSIRCGRVAKARLINLISCGRVVYDTENIDKTYPDTIDRLIKDLNIFVRIKIEKFESKYGRQLGWIYDLNDLNCARSFNQILLDEHYAYPYNGGSKLTILEQLKFLHQPI